MTYVYKVPLPLLDKLYKIREETGIPIARQIRIGTEDYIFRHERSQSPFMRALGEYKKPKKGEKLKTERGEAEVIDVIFYKAVIEELESGGFPKDEIIKFTERVEHFLGRKENYFECDVRYEDGETETIDWSEYLALLNKKGD